MNKDNIFDLKTIRYNKFRSPFSKKVLTYDFYGAIVLPEGSADPFLFDTKKLGRFLFCSSQTKTNGYEADGFYE